MSSAASTQLPSNPEYCYCSRPLGIWGGEVVRCRRLRPPTKAYLSYRRSDWRKGRTMKNHLRPWYRGVLVSVATGAAVAFMVGSAVAQETFKLGIVTFLSGPAAESFGVPA